MSRSVTVKVVRQRTPQTADNERAVVFWNELQCCEALGIGQTTLDAWRRDGLPHMKRGRVILFVPEDVREFVRSHYAPTIRRVG